MKICWATRFYTYSPNIRLRKDNFSRQHFKNHKSNPLLPSTPAHVHDVHALAFHPHPNFAVPLAGSAFKIRSEVCGGVFFFRKQSTCLGCWLFMRCLRRGAPSLMFGNSVFGGFRHWNYTGESWTPPASYSWFTPNTNTIRCKLGLTPGSHFLEGELIRWVGKAKGQARLKVCD